MMSVFEICGCRMSVCRARDVAGLSRRSHDEFIVRADSGENGDSMAAVGCRTRTRLLRMLPGVTKYQMVSPHSSRSLFRGFQPAAR